MFCSIVGKKLPAERVYEDDDILAFSDTQPAAPMHLLVVPKRHVSSLDTLSDEQLAGRLLLTARQLGRQHDRAGHGYRVVTNTGQQAEVDHLHFHVVGGKPSLGRIVS